MDDLRHKLSRRLSKIKGRCYNKNNNRYSNYGARGIVVCDEWNENTESFIQWSLNNGYKEGLSIDRIDNNGPYSPSNCRWVNDYVQANNKSDTLYIEYRGKRKSLAEWCRELDISYEMTRKRFHKGWSIEELFNTDSNCHYVKLKINGEEKTITEWSKIYNIPRTIIAQRYYKGDSPEECLREVGEFKQRDLIDIEGEKITFKEAAQKLNISYFTLKGRRRRGWSDEEIITGKRRN